MSRLIRSEAISATGAFRFRDYEREARAVLDSARQQADRLIADARRAAAQQQAAERRDGYAEGLELGRREGREAIIREAQAAGVSAAIEAARANVAQLEHALQRTLADFETQKRSLIASAESGLIELAIAVARRVCKQVAADSNAIALANVRAVLELVQNVDDVTIRLHPQDHAQLADAAPALLTQASQHQHVALVADASVDRGGCVLTSAAGSIDARIETQLDRIAAAICHPNQQDNQP